MAYVYNVIVFSLSNLSAKWMNAYCLKKLTLMAELMLQIYIPAALVSAKHRSRVLANLNGNSLWHP